MARRLKHLWRRRGAVLMLMGCASILIGISVTVNPMLAPPNVYLFHEHLPVGLRSFLWIVTGLTAIGFSPSCLRRGRDRWGFTVLMVMPIQRFCSYLAAWVLSLFDIEGGYGQGWLAATVWGVWCGLILVCAGWPDPSRRVPAPPSKS